MTDDFTDVIQNEVRLEALRRTSLLDSPPEEAFDRLTRMATTVPRVPAALVSLVDRDRLFFKSQSGLAEPLASLRRVLCSARSASMRSTPAKHSWCRTPEESR
jgi:hypothetical protein